MVVVGGGRTPFIVARGVGELSGLSMTRSPHQLLYAKMLASVQDTLYRSFMELMLRY